MAVIKKDGNSMGLPMNINRGNPIPLDTTEIWYSLSDAQNYAQTGATAYVGQIIVVVNEAKKSAQAFMIANVEGELVEVGSGTGSAMIFVDTVAGLTTLGTPPTGVPNDLAIGQQAFVSADKKIYFLTATGASAPTSYVWESQASDAPVWDASGETFNNQPVKFATGSTYDGDFSKYSDPATLYYIENTSTWDEGNAGTGGNGVITRHLLFNGIDYSQKIAFIDNIDSNVEPSDAVEGYLYYFADNTNPNNPGRFFTKHNGQLISLDPDLSDLATKNELESAISEIVTSFNSTTGALSVGEKSATLINVAHAPTYDATNLKLTIPVYGGSDVVVNIPKDKFVTAGEYQDNAPLPGGGTGPAIVLTIDNQEAPVIIPAASLVNILTAENTNTVIMQISDDNSKISASIKIDPSSDNAITSSASGIKVDLSGKMDAITGATGGKIAVTDAAGNVDESAFAIQSTGDLSSMTANDIPVATVIAAAINAVQTTISQGKLDKLTGSAADAGKLVVVGADGASITFGALTIQDIQTALANKVDKITGTENDIVTLGTNGAIKDSGKTAGGATLASTPDANTLATEAAVKSALDDAALSWIEI